MMLVNVVKQLLVVVERKMTTFEAAVPNNSCLLVANLDVLNLNRRERLVVDRTVQML